MTRPVFGGPAAYAVNGGNEWRGSGGVGVDDLFNVTSVLDDRNICSDQQYANLGAVIR